MAPRQALGLPVLLSKDPPEALAFQVPALEGAARMPVARSGVAACVCWFPRCPAVFLVGAGL